MDTSRSCQEKLGMRRWNSIRPAPPARLRGWTSNVGTTPSTLRNSPEMEDSAKIEFALGVVPDQRLCLWSVSPKHARDAAGRMAVAFWHAPRLFPGLGFCLPNPTFGFPNLISGVPSRTFAAESSTFGVPSQTSASRIRLLPSRVGHLPSRVRPGRPGSDFPSPH